MLSFPQVCSDVSIWLSPFAANNQLSSDSWLRMEVVLTGLYASMTIFSLNKKERQKKEKLSPKDGDYAKDSVYGECPAEHTFLVQWCG